MAKSDVTLLLERVQDGDKGAREDLVASVYRQLRATAASLLSRERKGHTLLTADLVHEAYLRMFKGESPQWRDRMHFFRSAAVAMRRVLIDHARKQQAGRRIPKEAQVPLDLAVEPATPDGVDLLLLDQALNQLAEVSPRQAKVVELRYILGLTEPEVAEVLEISAITVSRDWKVAKLWLRRAMRSAETQG